MGTRHLILDGENLADGTNITIVCDGVSVFSGEVTKAVTPGLGDDIGIIHTWEVAAHDETDAEWDVSAELYTLATDSTVSISVVSGILNCGSITRKLIDDNPREWQANVDERKNILIDGAVAHDGDTTGQVFTVTAGQTLTCVCSVDPIPQNR